MAILLHEEGLLKRAQLYGTDFNGHVLEAAKKGIYDKEILPEFIENYKIAGGKQDLSQYYIDEGDSIRMRPFLREKIIFAEHNLAADKVFGEMHCVICRNVLIYFNKILQNVALHLFHESLCPAGFLCLGIKETLQFSECEKEFDIIDEKQKIFRKKYQYE